MKIILNHDSNVTWITGIKAKNQKIVQMVQIGNYDVNISMSSKCYNYSRLQRKKNLTFNIYFYVKKTDLYEDCELVKIFLNPNRKETEHLT